MRNKFVISENKDQSVYQYTHIITQLNYPYSIITVYKNMALKGSTTYFNIKHANDLYKLQVINDEFINTNNLELIFIEAFEYFRMNILKS